SVPRRRARDDHRRGPRPHWRRGRRRGRRRLRARPARARMDGPAACSRRPDRPRPRAADDQRPRLRDAHAAPPDGGGARPVARDRHARGLRPRARVAGPDRALLGMSATDTIRAFWNGRAAVDGHVASRFHSEHDRYDLPAIAALCGPGARILDLGCGTCSVANTLVERTPCSVHAVDYVAEFLEAAIADPRLTTEVGDVRAYRRDERFDAILLLGVI